MSMCLFSIMLWGWTSSRETWILVLIKAQKHLCDLRPAVPDLWATAHYWAVAYLQLGCMNSGPVRTHAQLNSHNRQASALAWHVQLNWHKSSCAHVCACWYTAHEAQFLSLHPTSQASKPQRLGTALSQSLSLSFRKKEMKNYFQKYYLENFITA